MKTLIIIPTYNERQNIEKLVKEILIFYPEAQILVVDDNSPDGTSKIVEQMARKYENIHLMLRLEKFGLGNALKDGYQWALARNFDCILQMDADFSHNPAEISQILNEIKSGAELVIGSRYKDGFRVKGRSIFRMGVSYFANLYTKAVLGFNIYDATSGFRCFRGSILKDIDLSLLLSEGYAFQIEMTYMCYKKGYCIKEIPILFNRRKEGNSKFNLKIIVEAFFTVLRLRFFKIG
jgi:dolichol-phosphate mannosyltransferase